MELYLHTVAGGEDPEILQTEPTVSVAELTVVQEGQPPLMLWRQDEDEPLGSETTLGAAGIEEHEHLHRGRCRRVDVRVRYGGLDHERDFSPAATIERVFKWATGPEAFKLSEEERVKHVLALPGADHFLAWTVHVGSLVSPDTCTVVLELAPKERFEG